MKVRFADYLINAFNARPAGMFVSPNWIGLGAFALLGLHDPGFWLVGAGVELLYLFWLVSNRRFRKWVDGRLLSRETSGWQGKVDRLVEGLDHAAGMRYRGLESRCRAILGEPGPLDTAEAKAPLSQVLGRLSWIYLQLLITRQATMRVLSESEAGMHGGRGVRGSIGERAAELERRLKSETLDGDLKRSLTGQLELLTQRLASQREAREKVDFIDSELTRVEEQVQLVRDQAILAHDPDSASRRIDAISSTQGTTTQWIRDQHRLSGELSEALEDVPPGILPMEAERGG